MKSVVKKKNQPANMSVQKKNDEKKVAQCCAKISKTVAGCHD